MSWTRSEAEREDYIARHGCRVELRCPGCDETWTTWADYGEVYRQPDCPRCGEPGTEEEA